MYYDWCLLLGEKRQGDTQGEDGHVTTEAETEAMHLQTNGCQGLPANARR